jgi:hypothetical protein
MKMCCALMRQTGKKVHPSLDGSSSILFPPANNTAANNTKLLLSPYVLYTKIQEALDNFEY